MARAGAELLYARLELVERIRPHLARAYAELTDASKPADAIYRSTLQNQVDDDGAPLMRDAGTGAGGTSPETEDLRLLSVEQLTERYVRAFAEARRKEL